MFGVSSSFDPPSRYFFRPMGTPGAQLDYWGANSYREGSNDPSVIFPNRSADFYNVQDAHVNGEPDVTQVSNQLSFSAAQFPGHNSAFKHQVRLRFSIYNALPGSTLTDVAPAFGETLRVFRAGPCESMREVFIDISPTTRAQPAFGFIDQLNDVGWYTYSCILSDMNNNSALSLQLNNASYAGTIYNAWPDHQFIKKGQGFELDQYDVPVAIDQVGYWPICPPGLLP